MQTKKQKPANPLADLIKLAKLEAIVTAQTSVLIKKK